MPSTPSRRKRKVGQSLARLREAAGRTVEDAGLLLRKTGSQISKIENGYYLCAYSELTALLVYYEATADRRAEVVTLWEDAKQDGRRISGSSVFPPKFRTFLRNEADADTMNELASCAIPGLLQTEQYAIAVMYAARRMAIPSVNFERIAAARLERRKLLEGANPLTLHVVIDEGVIRRIVGSRKIMGEQLRHLAVTGKRDNVTIQVIGEDAGAYGTMSGPMAILGFNDPEDPDSVYLEHQAGGEWVDNREDVAKFKETFSDVSGLALSAAESTVLIEARAEELEEL